MGGNFLDMYPPKPTHLLLDVPTPHSQTSRSRSLSKSIYSCHTMLLTGGDKWSPGSKSRVWGRERAGVILISYFAKVT